MTGLRNAVAALIRSGWTFVAVWMLSRAFLGFEWRTSSSYIVGDVNYYFHQLESRGVAIALQEYPTPVAWWLELLRNVTGNQVGAFIWGFTASMVALDAAMGWLLWRHGGRYRELAAAAWIAYVAFIGPLAYFRFDLAPAVVAGAAVLLAVRRPGIAGVLVAVGASIKLWPALLLVPLLSGTSEQRRRSLIGFGTTGTTLALVALVGGGWARLIAPLTWQSDRGLQIESIPATWLMWRRTFESSSSWVVGLSRYNAYEITGPGVDTWLTVASLLTVAAFVVIAVLADRTWRSPRSVVQVGAGMLAIIAAMIVANKTLSPQYMIWLGGPLCALIAGSSDSDEDVVRWPLPLLCGGLVIALGTQQVYPIMYGELVSRHGTPAATSVLVLRNIAVVAFMAAALTYSMRRTGTLRGSADNDSVIASGHHGPLC